MSNTDTEVQAETVETVAAESAALSPAQKLIKTWDDKSRVIVKSGATLEPLQALIAELTTRSVAVADWTDESLGWADPSYLLVKSDNDEIRLAALPNKQTVLADAVAGDYLYNIYLAKGALALKKGEDVVAAMFRSASGFLTGFDKDAFKFQVDQWLKLLKEKGAALNAKKLAEALSSTAHAKTLYGKVPQSFWEAILGNMIKKAEKAGYNAALLIHWQQTRDEATVEIPEFKWTLDELEHVGEETAVAAA